MIVPTTHKLINGDGRSMSLKPYYSVQLTVTSPQYWQLKDYESKEQIGFNDTYKEYINRLNFVRGECYRVMSNCCRSCVNIGDQFARSVYYGRYKVIPIHTEVFLFLRSYRIWLYGQYFMEKGYKYAYIWRSEGYG